MTEYEKLQKEIENIKEETKLKETEKEKLVQENEIIKKYIELEEEIKKNKQEIERYTRIIQYAKMYDCNHIFIITKKYKNEDVEKQIFQCICCGFTNNVPDGLKEFKKDCFKKTRKNSSLLLKEELDYFETEKMYKEILFNNPGITKEKIMNLLRKRINGNQKVKK